MSRDGRDLGPEAKPQTVEAPEQKAPPKRGRTAERCGNPSGGRACQPGSSGLKEACEPEHHQQPLSARDSEMAEGPAAVGSVLAAPQGGRSRGEVRKAKSAAAKPRGRRAATAKVARECPAAETSVEPAGGAVGPIVTSQQAPLAAAAQQTGSPGGKRPKQGSSFQEQAEGIAGSFAAGGAQEAAACLLRLWSIFLRLSNIGE